MPDTPDTPDAPGGPEGPAPGPFTLVVRAAFVPDGEQPPPEFQSAFDPLRIRATLDPTTGAITCDNAGMNFDGDVRAEWHPDARQGTDEDGAPDGDTSGSDETASGGQRDQPLGAGAARSRRRTRFGLGGNGSRDGP